MILRFLGAMRFNEGHSFGGACTGEQLSYPHLRLKRLDLLLVSLGVTPEVAIDVQRHGHRTLAEAHL